MTRKKTGSSDTAKENRATARKTQIPGGKPGERFKGTKQAREGGMYLPTADQKAKNKVQQDKIAVETPKKVDLKKKADEIINREQDKKKR